MTPKSAADLAESFANRERATIYEQIFFACGDSAELHERLEMISSRFHAGCVQGYLAGHAAGLAEAGELVEALERVAQHHWFDGKLKESYGLACGMCDMGDAGEAVNTADGHDLQCPVSIAHWTLARFKAIAGDV